MALDESEYLDAVAKHAPASTREVAEAVGVTRQGADYRLRGLAEDGKVESKMAGNSLIWFPVDDAEPEPGDESDEDAPRDAGPPRDDQPPAEPPERRGGAPAASQSNAESEPGVEDVADAVDGIDFPAAQDREACVEAIAAARDYLRDEGPASMREIVMNVMPSVPLQYDVPDLEPGDRYRGAWWRKVVRPGLAALDAVEYREGYGDYRFIEVDEDGGERP